MAHQDCLTAPSDTRSTNGTLRLQSSALASRLRPYAFSTLHGQSSVVVVSDDNRLHQLEPVSNEEEIDFKSSAKPHSDWKQQSPIEHIFSAGNETSQSGTSEYDSLDLETGRHHSPSV